MPIYATNTALKAADIRKKSIAALRKYATAQHDVGQAAVNTFHHAVIHGDTSTMHHLFISMDEGVQVLFKKWLGKVSSYQDDPDSPTKVFIKFVTKVAGPDDYHFKLIGPSKVRKDLAERLKKMNNIEYPDMFADHKKKPKQVDLVALLQMAAKLADAMTKKAEKEDIDLPPGIELEVQKLSEHAKQEIARVQAAEALEKAQEKVTEGQPAEGPAQPALEATPA